MNRFRELKDRLIKSKRDSQKLPTQTQIENWVEKSLEYYGISPSSYRLKQLKHLFQIQQNTTEHEEQQKQNAQKQLIKQKQAKNENKQNMKLQKSLNINPEGKSDAIQNLQSKNFIRDQSKASVNLIQKKGFFVKQPFLKKNSSFQQTENQMRLSNAQNQGNLDEQQSDKASHKKSSKISLHVSSYKGKDKHLKEESNQTKNQQSNTISKIICKKTRNEQMSSMNDMDSMKKTQIQNYQKTNQTQYQTENKAESQKGNMNKNLLSIDQNPKKDLQTKQLDYYTLILQLTAELNYSRVNKETHNQKSILKQIKNLISYIEGNSNSSTENSSQPLTDPHSNIKSCHTFSSIHSNDSLNTAPNQNQFIYSSLLQIDPLRVQRCIQQSQNQQSNDFNVSGNYQQNFNDEEHNSTFKSIDQFSEQNSSDSHQNSIIDFVNQNSSPNHDVIRIQQTEDEQNIVIQNSPLSRITQHQSEYTNSIQPSANESPSKLNSRKIFKQKLNFLSFHSSVSQKPLKIFSQKNIQNSQEKGDYKESANWFNFLPQNELILKKLSDKLQNTQNCQHIFEQSLEYKRILYMLDSEYATSDFKNRTFSTLGQTSSHQMNQSGSQKSISLYYLKNPSDFSAKSFNKEIFESNEESQNKYFHKSNKKCLMNNLDALFKNESFKNPKSPQLLKFQFQNENENESYFNQSQKVKKHQRSKTSLESPNKGLRKSKKYRLNLLSELSQQIDQESEQNAFDRKKYQNLKTQNQDDSVYQRVSRKSYLTSSSPNSNVITSSESELEGQLSFIEKPKLILKKINKESQLNQQKNTLIIKKKKITKMSQNSDSQNTKRFFRQNKQNLQSHQILSNISPASQYQKSQSESFRKQRSQIKDFQILSGGLSSQDSFMKSFPQLDHQNHKQGSQIFQQLKMEESKISQMGCRPIKYKVYGRENQTGEKQDKRKVLKDIVSILKTKYNKNIQLKE